MIIMQIRFADYEASRNRSVLLSMVNFSGRFVHAVSSSDLKLSMSTASTTPTGRFFHSVAVLK